MFSPHAHAKPVGLNGGSAPRCDQARGGVSIPGVGRVAMLPATFVRELHRAIVEAHPDTAPDVLYRIGFEWALESMVSLTVRERSSALAPTATMFAAWWESFRAAGWGALRRIELRGGVALLELDQGAVGPALGRSDDPVCHLYAGLFAGGLSFLWKEERHGVEVECRAAGADICRFIIGPHSTIDDVETWRQQGVRAEHILSRVGTAATQPDAVNRADAASSAPAVVLRDPRGERLVGGTVELLRSLRFVLESENAGNWHAVLKATGRSVGRALGVQQDAARRLGLRETGQPAPSDRLVALASLFAEYGWGRLHVDASAVASCGFVVASIDGSIFGELPRERGAAVEPFAAGALLGYSEHVTAGTLACEELRAAAPCAFVVGSATQLAAVSSYLGRASVEEVIARLRS